MAALLHLNFLLNHLRTWAGEDGTAHPSTLLGLCTDSESHFVADIQVVDENQDVGH
jgi:hypothetical protein